MIGTQGRNTTYNQFVSSYSVRYKSSGSTSFSTIWDASLKEKVEYSLNEHQFRDIILLMETVA